jgi:hypothetical protein
MPNDHEVKVKTIERRGSFITTSRFTKILKQYYFGIRKILMEFNEVLEVQRKHVMI